MNKEEAIEELNSECDCIFWENGKCQYNNGKSKCNKGIATEVVLAELEKCEKKLKMLIEEREHIKNNLEIDLNKKGVYSQAKGQIAQILEYYKNNEQYFEKKVGE